LSTGTALGGDQLVPKLVCVFNSKENLEEILKMIQPDIMVVGEDWKGKEIVGGEYADEIRYFPKSEHSTTKIVDKLYGNCGIHCPRVGR